MINPFQMIVDATQKQPHQWAYWMCWPMLFFVALIPTLLTFKDGVGGAFLTATYAGMWIFFRHIGRSAAMTAAVGTWNMLAACVIFTGVSFFIWNFNQKLIYILAVVGANFCTCLFICFAMCRPPKPPTPKHNLRHAFG